ncbi:hypothetical protein [Verminephrobacter eiseniae]|uniref:hypothetical protein n=1 Tax=Verminephrobacter eiseniae TaxID=364317 RepID=UPI002238C2DA|nr:hypothetical protein [Verminephrobacter eiseniae]
MPSIYRHPDGVWPNTLALAATLLTYPAGLGLLLVPGMGWALACNALGLFLLVLSLVSRHRSSVGLRWPSKRIAALHRLPIQLGMGCAMRLALRSDGCAQPATSDP